MYMKRCPLCKMLVADKSQCHICKTTITFEPDVESDHEEFIFNKYGVLYLLGKLWISVLSFLVGLVTIIWKRPPFSEALVFAIILTSFSLHSAIRHRHLVAKDFRFNEEFAEAHYMLWKYVTAIIAIIVYVFLAIYSY